MLLERLEQSLAGGEDEPAAAEEEEELEDIPDDDAPAAEGELVDPDAPAAEAPAAEAPAAEAPAAEPRATRASTAAPAAPAAAPPAAEVVGGLRPPWARASLFQAGTVRLSTDGSTWRVQQQPGGRSVWKLVSHTEDSGRSTDGQVV